MDLERVNKRLNELNDEMIRMLEEVKSFERTAIKTSDRYRYKYTALSKAHRELRANYEQQAKLIDRLNLKIKRLELEVLGKVSV